ncbi:VWA domain-containing protein [Rubripirellula reticaptiva]|uniref:von Willebrand factor type A domain protein n=1 Tax=Rubripirellula reticaptiva TaxID=2528013 RepID=A0A5C6EVE0_9BACT|nr:VWA domain-containing protein [Rubripirellula reticaptiva]TWU51221.1 von Willebrand factor type A domain protein [Rubripirellula reticaptiva]
MFLYPGWLALLLIIPLLAWRSWHRRDPMSISFSSAAALWDERPTWRQRLAWLPVALSLAALALMIISLARPRYGKEQTIVTSEGIAIEMVVDRSGSMQALDFKIDGTNVDRLTAIKNVASKFVLGNPDALRSNRSSDEHDEDQDTAVAGRVSDLIGLITFAGYADAITPPTLDHPFLVAQLENTEIVNDRNEDGTAIGDALSLAVDKLSSLDEKVEDTDKRQSKVIILLTDGENTAGETEPSEGAELAKAMGIKVYTIGVGTKGQAPFPVRRTRSGQILVDYVSVNIDEETLTQIADKTGGKYFRATDTDSLETIYGEIDKLEKTKVETQRFADYREMAVQDVRISGWHVPPLLVIALWFLAIAAVLRRTVFRVLT